MGCNLLNINDILDGRVALHVAGSPLTGVGAPDCDTMDCFLVDVSYLYNDKSGFNHEV